MSAPVVRCAGSEPGPEPCRPLHVPRCSWRARVGERSVVYVRDVLTCLRYVATASVHCVVTSPPYWGLRDYGVAPTVWPAVTFKPAHDLPEVTVPAMVCAHGLEPDLLSFVAHVVLVFREVARVLRPDGAAWINFGDSYATGTEADRNPSRPASLGRAQRKPAGWTNRCQRERRSPEGLAAKNLLLMPHRVALALQADGWIVRQDEVWAKPAPMPEAVSDRSTRAHEYNFHCARSQKYFHDAFAVAEPCSAPQANTEADRARAFSRRRATVVAPTQAAIVPSRSRNEERRTDGSRGRLDHRGTSVPWEGHSRNPRSVRAWSAKPFKGSHFATFPPDLPAEYVMASTSEVGACPHCGAFWRRIFTRGEPARDWRSADTPSELHGSHGRRRSHGQPPDVGQNSAPRAHVGWERPCRCPHARPAPCVVLDPFAGSGTTLAVAEALGRAAVGVEAQPAYVADLMPARFADVAARFARPRAPKRRPAAPAPASTTQADNGPLFAPARARPGATAP